MRMMLVSQQASVDPGPDPLVESWTTPGTYTFDVAEAIAAGYNKFEAIVIGGAGGGGHQTFNNFNLYGGGAGGGGGLYWAKGDLSSLPSLVDVAVGSAGIDRTEAQSGGAGGNGGFSRFDSFTASGGKGGAASTGSAPGAGGVGGIGGSTTAGGGTSWASGDGVWNGIVGSGGAGGAGGHWNAAAGTSTIAAKAGRNGSYNAGDLSVWGEGVTPDTTDPSTSIDYYGGPGGGGRLQALDPDDPTQYGTPIWRSGVAQQYSPVSADGAVAVRVYYDDTLPPLLVLDSPGSHDIDIAAYRAAGYTNFEVIVVGAAGGRGGDHYYTAWGTRPQGSGGGGGGVQRAAGSLASLPSPVTAVVGQGGADGVDSQTATGGTKGSDGGFSSFNGTTARASGGEGGNTWTGSLEFYTPGVAGGVGGRTAVGGGAVGNASGAWNSGSGIGSGGGGGGGGTVWDGDPTPSPDGQNGGSGAVGDTNYEAAGWPKGTASGHYNAAGGGFGGGSKVKALTGTDMAYGSGGDDVNRTKNGVVVVKFS